jgi:proline iminopeptidase
MRRIGKPAVVGLFLFMAAVAPSFARPEPAADTFDILQQNAWNLKTSDKEASLYITEIGHGPIVVVLHGGPGQDFHYLVDAVRPNTGRFRFILFDQRGSVLSPVSEAKTKSLTLAKLVDDLETLRQALGEDKLILMAHSAGNALAMGYYKAHPDRVKGLVLADSQPPGLETPEWDKAFAARRDAQIHRPEVQTTLAAAGLDKDPAQLTPRQRDELWRLTHLIPMDVYRLDHWRRFEGGGSWYNADAAEAISIATDPAACDIAGVLAAHPVPITVIDGDHDFIDPSGAGWLSLAAEHPEIRIFPLKSAGHYSWIDNPEGFDRSLRAGLELAASSSRH